MKLPIFGFLALGIYFSAYADCNHNLDLEGSVSISECNSKTQHCVSAGRALYEYIEKSDDIENIYTIALQSSPWRLYGGDMRILDVHDLAVMIRPKISKEKSVKLIASWTGVSPDVKHPSLAQQLSKELSGFPVTGMDGFLWFTHKGESYTTKQTFTLGVPSGPYMVAEGEDVMAALTIGWTIYVEQLFQMQQNAEGLLRVGVGYDIYMLCPDKALQAFEAAADLNNPIGAYNAAIFRLDRGKKGDQEVAKELLKQAVKLGDKKAKAKLFSL